MACRCSSRAGSSSKQEFDCSFDRFALVWRGASIPMLENAYASRTHAVSKSDGSGTDSQDCDDVSGGDAHLHLGGHGYHRCALLVYLQEGWIFSLAFAAERDSPRQPGADLRTGVR